MLFLLIYDSANNSSQYLRTMCEYTIQKSMKTKSSVIYYVQRSVE